MTGFYEFEEREGGRFALKVRTGGGAPPQDVADAADAVARLAASAADDAMRDRLRPLSRRALVDGEPDALAELRALLAGAQPASAPQGGVVAAAALVSVPPPRKVQVRVEPAEATAAPETLQLAFEWKDGERTAAQSLLQLQILQTESQLRSLCLDRSAPTWLERIAAFLYPAQVAPSKDSFRRLLCKLACIAEETLNAALPDKAQLDGMVEVLRADAAATFSLHRRAEIIWRFSNALFVTLLLLGAAGALLVEARGALHESVAVTSGRIALTLVFFAGTAVGAWLSYVQRSISIPDRTVARDLEDLRTLTMDTVHPAARTLYVFAFAFLGALVFHFKAVEMDFGLFRTEHVLSEFKAALLAGALLGLAERTLPEAIGGRARSLAGGLQARAAGAQAAG